MSIFATLQSLCSMRLYRAERSVGSIVVLRFTLSPNNPNEDFYLRFDLCNWVIEKDDSEIINSDSDDIPTALQMLLNRTVLQIGLEHQFTNTVILHTATFIFDDAIQVKLHQYSNSDPTDPIFTARDSSRAWITYFSDGTLKAEQDATANP